MKWELVKKRTRKWRKKIHKSRPLFVDLPRRRRKKKTIDVRNRIRKERHNKFSTDTYILNNEIFISYLNEIKGKFSGLLTDSDDILDYISLHQWKDICFLSKKNKTLFYNCTVLTSSQYLDDSANPPWGGEYTNDPEITKKFINRNDFNPMDYQEQAILLRGYRCGIGLTLIVDAPYLTVENINNAIDAFWANGEKSYLSNKQPTKFLEYNRIHENMKCLMKRSTKYIFIPEIHVYFESLGK